MDFRFSDEDENFRRELRKCLAANLPGDHRKTAFAIEFFANEEGKEWEERLAWHKKMHAAGLIAIQYPKQYGGRGATITQQYIYDEELNRAGAPQLVNGQGIGLVGPTLIHWGTEEQRQRYLPIARSSSISYESHPGVGWITDSVEQDHGSWRRGCNRIASGRTAQAPIDTTSSSTS